MVNFSSLKANLQAKLSPIFKNRKLWLVLAGILAVYLILSLYLLIVGLSLKGTMAKTITAVRAGGAAIQAKDLAGAESQLNEAKNGLKSISGRYRLVDWIRFVPLLGGYVADGRHGINAGLTAFDTGQIVIEAIKPYADVLGFSGAATQQQVESAEDKIIFILETLDKISPQLETVGSKFTEIDKEIAAINPKRYPQSFRGMPIRSQLTTLQTSLDSAAETLSNIKPLLSLLPKLLGQAEPQTYLLIFQNDAEIRGSGGFLTAYAILETSRGKITPVLSQDIYELDSKFGNKLPAPEPIKKYLPLVYNWHLRDMNLSPDFKVSMDTFLPNYKSVAQYKDYDGVIAMDTQIVVDLLKILGPVGVADWGTYDAEIIPECNCPQVVYKMEEYATRPTFYIKENRKGMIGPLMHSILLNVMNSPKKLWPQFIEVGLNNINAKHIMFYFPDDPQMQQVVESFNAGGRIKEYQGDYFHLNDTNFAGAKSNLYITQDIEQVIETSGDGTVTKTVTIVYTNPQKASDCNLESGGLCLNGILRDWVRLYVPEGSQIVEVLGSDVQAVANKDLGKTVIEAFIELRPESRTKLVVKYTLPFKHQGGDYKLFIQKQPGAKNHHYTINFNGKTEEFDLNQDREVVL